MHHQPVPHTSHKIENQSKAQDHTKFSSPKEIDLSQYDKIRVVGKGSFGIATVCRKRRDCSLVVLKEIDLKKLPTQRERLFAINELIIEMEYANNGTLFDYLSFQSQMLEEQEVLIIFKQITMGMEYLHSKNIIHQDLKTANIFLSADGIVKIGDFGIARLLPSTRSMLIESNTTGTSELAPSGVSPEEEDNSKGNIQHHHHQTYGGARINLLFATYAGTPAYCSPEKCLGEPIDKKSDIWSLGCILYELATLRQTFEGSSLPAMINKITKVQYTPIKRNLSSDLRAILERMLTRDPVRRPQASEIASFIGQLLYRIQLDRYRINNLRSNYRTDLSTAVAALAANDQVGIDQIRCPNSLVYQVRLDQEHITVNRLNLPKTKRFKEIAKGSNHYLALSYDNIVYGWGDRTKGQLGICGLPTRNRPSASSHVSTDLVKAGVKGASSGKDHVEATSGSNTTTTSPDDNQQSKSMISDNNPLKNAVSAIRPFILNELSGRKITQIAAGNEFSIFLSKTGLVLSCGLGATGCLGHGNYDDCYTPMLVKSLLSTDVVSISCGIEHVVAVCGDGRALAWGSNKDGRLGIEPSQSSTSNNSTSYYINTPQPILIPKDVFIKKAICGAQSTIFIDSSSNCWACGLNTYNKLGLDSVRRFKGSHLVNGQPIPSKLNSLGTKQKAVSCSIGQNHSGILLDDGKLLIMGKDIDLRYDTYEKHKKRGFLHPKTTSSLLAASLNPGGSLCSSRSISKNKLNSSSCSTSISNVNDVEHLNEQQSLSMYDGDLDDQMLLSKKKDISKKQRRTYMEYIKKSRSIKKILNSSVVKVSCTSKFTLALTSDNRVYFWGTRCHYYQPTTLVAYNHRQLLQSLQNNLPSVEATRNSVPSSTDHNENKTTMKKPIETQLVASCADDCLMKIGATNDSLLDTIEKIGSDQPIIHVRDPKLVADSLEDLWILDYNCDDGNTHQNKGVSVSTSEITDKLNDSFTLDYCTNGYDRRHDVILKPQPIVGLYVPSIFKQNGHTICMSDIFCFDDDRFFIIFDTTVMPQQQQYQLPKSPNKYGNNANLHHQSIIPKSSNHPQDRTLQDQNHYHHQQKTTTNKNQPKQLKSPQNLQIKDDSVSVAALSSSSSSTTTTLSSKSSKITRGNSSKNYSNSIISVKNLDLKPSLRDLCSSKQNINVDSAYTDGHIEYQQASFEMDFDDDDDMMIKNDEALVSYSSRSSSVGKSGSTAMSSLVSLSNNRDLSISSVNTTDHTLVSTDDHQLQSLAYEEPFSLSNIAHMTSTRYEFIKSASSSDLTLPQRYQSSENLSMISSNNGNNLMNNYIVSNMNSYPAMLSKNNINQQKKFTASHLQRTSQHQTYVANLFNHYYREIDKSNYILRRRRPRHRTTTNSSITNIEETSDVQAGMIEDEACYGDEIIDEDSIPDWVRKELEQVQQIFIAPKSLSPPLSEGGECSGTNEQSHFLCEAKRQHHLNKPLEKSMTGKMRLNSSKDLVEEDNSTLIDYKQQHVNNKMRTEKKCANQLISDNRTTSDVGHADIPIVSASQQNPSNGVVSPKSQATLCVHEKANNGTVQDKRKRCYSMPSLEYNTMPPQGICDSATSIRHLQVENRFLSRELIEARCMLSKYRKTIDFMSQQLDQHKQPSEANNITCQSSRHLSNGGPCQQVKLTVRGKLSQRSESLLSFRKSVIKLFC